MQDFFFNLFTYASFAFLGLGLLVAFVISLTGDGRSALSALWTAWGFALCFFFMAYGLSPGLTDEGGDASGTPSGPVSGGEAMMLPAFRDYADRISAAAARLEGLVEGGGSLTAAEQARVNDLDNEFIAADPEVLYVPPHSETLPQLQSLLSRACERFGEACSELWVSGDRDVARQKYREGRQSLGEAKRILTDLEAWLPME